jgi:hypothetical protein
MTVLQKVHLRGRISRMFRRGRVKIVRCEDFWCGRLLLVLELSLFGENFRKRCFNEARENGGKVVWGPLKKESVKKFYVAKAGK